MKSLRFKAQMKEIIKNASVQELHINNHISTGMLNLYSNNNFVLFLKALEYKK